MKKNYIYNVLYQILILIIPLITIPYVSRVLSSNGIGVYSYTYSIVSYFIMVAMLGFANYGNREIAKSRDEIKKMSKVFKEIYFLQIIISSAVVVFYAIYISFFVQEYRMIATIQALYLFSCIFDINWFFFGIEKFKLTVIRNSIIKILSLFAIFLFVKTKNDVWIYTLILSGSTMLSNFCLLFFLKRYIVKTEKVYLNDIKRHLVPCLKLFLPVIAITIYRVMDKTMIGVMCDLSSVGYYENAEKIVGVPSVIISALGVVMLPRMTNIYSKEGKNKNLNPERIIFKSVCFVMFLCFAMVLGIVAISDNFSMFFFGDGFNGIGKYISLLSFSLIFVAFGNVIRTQYLIPKEMDKEYITSAFIGAGVNIIFNYVLIKLIGGLGACIGTIFAEASVTIYQCLCVRKCLPIKKYIFSCFPFLIKSLLMMIVLILLNQIIKPSIILIFIQIIVGIIVYLLININYIKPIIIDFINKFFKKKRKVI